MQASMHLFSAEAGDADIRVTGRDDDDGTFGVIFTEGNSAITVCLTEDQLAVLHDQCSRRLANQKQPIVPIAQEAR